MNVVHVKMADTNRVLYIIDGMKISTEKLLLVAGFVWTDDQAATSATSAVGPCP